MPGKRNARSRVRGSWAARLTGAGFAILLAAAGVAVYLVVGARADNSANVLPTRVLGTQAIGLIATPGGSGTAADALVASRPGLAFSAMAQAGADWTADQMAGGTYIFIYIPDGLCLGGTSRLTEVSLQRCNLQASQRWVRQRLVVASGLDFWELRNLASGRCVTAADGAARLEGCQASPGASQLIAFLTTS
jgi:hypothetical protein